MHDMGATSDTGGGVDQNLHDMSNMSDGGMDHSMHNMSGMQEVPQAGKRPIDPAGFGSKREITHIGSEFGPQVDMRSSTPQDGLSDPGIGLRDHQRMYGRRVLTYADIRNLERTADSRDPTREIELHLTGNMSRYMWSINGIKFADAEVEVEATVKRDGEEINNSGYEAFPFRRVSGEWKVVHSHSSSRPVKQ